MKKLLLSLCLIAVVLNSCKKAEPKEQDDNNSQGQTSGLYAQVDSKALRDATDPIKGDIIPDFSRVGYQWGDKAIPTRPVVKEVSPPAGGADARALIQNAINDVAKLPLEQRGAILLKKGLYNISDKITITESGIVLRGEGNDDNPTTSTVLVATKITTTVDQDTHLIEIGNSSKLVVTTQINIKDSYVPVGQFWVTVTNASSFVVGDKVTLYRPGNDAWISDLKMDQIAGTDVTQWTTSRFTFHAERVVTKIKADTLWFENPVVMAIETKYGGGGVCKYTFDRISEVGVENLFIKSAYNNRLKSGDDFIDENHTWTAIYFNSAEHGWVRNVAAKYFAYALVFLDSKAKNITVADCNNSEPVSIVTGSRRYPFLNGGQLSLFINCYSQGGRHSYNASPSNSGPNAYVNCTEANARADCGPHHRWNMGTLYDNIVTNGEINVQDRGDSGSGHGWAGVNNVLWNCTVSQAAVQSPWVSGRNFAIGVKGGKNLGVVFKNRPDGYWASQNQSVAPQSLYQAQLELRRKLQPGGVMDVPQH